MKTFSWRAAAACVCLAMAGGTAVAAPIVNFVTGLSLSMDPSTTGSLTMQFTNAGDATQGINTYTLAIMAIQTSGTGVLTFDSWTKPASPLITDPITEYTPFDPPELFTLNAPIVIDGTDYFDYYSVQVAATDGFNYQLFAGNTKNAGLMTFTNDGPGTWDLYVVNQERQTGGLPVTLLQTADTTDYGFGNLPEGNGEYLKIGTITAVPEPSTVALAGMAFAAVLVPGIRCRFGSRKDASLSNDRA